MTATATPNTLVARPSSASDPTGDSFVHDWPRDLQFRIPPKLEAAYEKLVQGQPIAESELLVLTQEGLAYSTQLRTLSHHILTGDGITVENA